VVLLLPAAAPAARDDAARCKPAADDADRAAARQADVDSAARGKVAARGDEAAGGEAGDRLVDRERLHDAVQVELQARRPAQDPPVEPHLPQPRGGRRPGRRPVRGEQGEISVVAGGLEGGAERRIDEAVRIGRRVEGRPQRAREQRRDVQRPGRRCVYERKLGVGEKTAEHPLPAREDRGHGGRVAACEHDLAAHGAETVDRRHEVLVTTGGGWTGGAIRPPLSAPCRRARSKAAGAASGCRRFLAWPGACAFAPTKATPKTSVASAPTANFAPRARARACSIRERRPGLGPRSACATAAMPWSVDSLD